LNLLIAAALAAAAPAPAHTCPELITAEALICRAIQAQAEGKDEAAAQSFEEAANASPEKDPAKARMLAAAGNMWLSAGQAGKAALALDRALAVPGGLEAEQHGEALLDRARAAEAQSDLKTARAKLNEAAASISDDPFYWYFSAALAVRENDAATAQSAINKALAMTPADASILFEAGHVAHFAGDDVGARNYWQRASERDPHGPIGNAARDALNLLPAPLTVKLEPAAPPKK
jgi:tetratricopeptide (TPR) repeat protein